MLLENHPRRGGNSHLNLHCATSHYPPVDYFPVTVTCLKCFIPYLMDNVKKYQIAVNIIRAMISDKYVSGKM